MTIDPITQSDKHVARIDRFIRTAADIMLAFDSDPAQEQTPDGWPCDQLAYSWAAHRRDHSMWDAFRPVEECLDSVLATANAQLDRLPTASRSEWQSRIDALTRAAETLAAENDLAIGRLRDHLVRENANIATVDHILTEFFDEAWPALDVWAGGGHAVIELNATVHQGAIHPVAPKTALRIVSGGIAPPSAPGQPRGGRR